MANKEYRAGDLILEGNIKISFDMTFDCYEDVPDWIKDVEDFVTPTSDFISITEKTTYKDYLIPTNKILAYNLNY